MAKQLMIYDNLVPVSADRHQDLSVESGVPYHFAKEVRAVPLVAEEIPHAAREYTVVFAVTDKEMGTTAPFVILGVKENENLYVTEKGEWTAKYIPAFVRRYPFVFSAVPDDDKKFILCIDETWQGCNREGRGQRLFEDDGKKSAFLDRLLKFHEDYQRSALRTGQFCAKLDELGLLVMQEVRLTPKPGEEPLKLRGFKVVDREKLRSLPAEALTGLAKSGALDLVYAHLLSLASMGQMVERVAETTLPSPAETTTG